MDHNPENGTHHDDEPALDPSSREMTRSLSPDDSTSSSEPMAPLKRPESVGPYTIIGVLGRGGMGVVYRASQESPRREVALKLIRPGMVTGSLLKRFQLEADILARFIIPGLRRSIRRGCTRGRRTL